MRRVLIVMAVIGIFGEMLSCSVAVAENSLALLHRFRGDVTVISQGVQREPYLKMELFNIRGTVGQMGVEFRVIKFMALITCTCCHFSVIVLAFSFATITVTSTSFCNPLQRATMCDSIPPLTGEKNFPICAIFSGTVLISPVTKRKSELRHETPFLYYPCYFCNHGVKCWLREMLAPLALT